MWKDGKAITAEAGLNKFSGVGARGNLCVSTSLCPKSCIKSDKLTHPLVNSFSHR